MAPTSRSSATPAGTASTRKQSSVSATSQTPSASSAGAATARRMLTRQSVNNTTSSSSSASGSRLTAPTSSSAARSAPSRNASATPASSARAPATSAIRRVSRETTTASTTRRRDDSATPAPTPPSKRVTPAATPGTAAVTRSSPRTPAAPRAQLLAGKTPGTAMQTKSADAQSAPADAMPLKTYLRIRPSASAAAASDEGVPSSYIRVLSDTEVAMVPPADHRLVTSSSLYPGSYQQQQQQYAGSLVGAASFSLAALALDPSSHPSTPQSADNAAPAHIAQPAPLPVIQGTRYRFTHVLDTDATQQDAYERAGRPLVERFVSQGDNCLLFAFGTTGSGKTYTTIGGTDRHGENSEAGLAKRVIASTFKSLEGKIARSNGRNVLRPCKLNKVEKVSASSDAAKPHHVASGASHEDIPADTLPTEPGYEYSVWVSFAEIYNEKVYDLLDSPEPLKLLPTPSGASGSSATPSYISTSFFGSLVGAKAKAAFGRLHGGHHSGSSATPASSSQHTVKRNALSLKHDKDANHKYIHGLRDVRVESAGEALALLALGHQNRRVYSTLANRASSRSHSSFTLKLVRTPVGRSDDVAHAHVARFSIVDLAGSERHANTQTTGDRLKEAGNINKSLMVLGQCMDMLRRNQAAGPNAKHAVVPFRHSKLTEIFQSFFVGDGQAAMVVTVNPHGTSFDENNHVMKFAAIARDVMTVQEAKPAPMSPSPSVAADDARDTSTPIRAVPTRKDERQSRLVRMSFIDDGGDEHDILYEEAEAEDDDEDEDVFVNALLDEVSYLRNELYEARRDAILGEAAARQRVVKEYEAKMAQMQRDFDERLASAVSAAKQLADRKLDIMSRIHQSRAAAHEDEEDELDSDEEVDDDDVEALLHEKSAPLESPLAGHTVGVACLGSPQASDASEDDVEGEDLEEAEAQSEHSDAAETEDDYAPSPPRVRKNRASTSSAVKRTPLQESDEINQSVIVQPGKSETKKKRKLGLHKVVDADDMDDLTDEFAPLRKTSSTLSLTRRL